MEVKISGRDSVENAMEEENRQWEECYTLLFLPPFYSEMEASMTILKYGTFEKGRCTPRIVEQNDRRRMALDCCGAPIPPQMAALYFLNTRNKTWFFLSHLFEFPL